MTKGGDMSDTKAPVLRELFVEELAEVQGGCEVGYKDVCVADTYTTYACCEEGPLDGCCIPYDYEISP